MAVDSTMEFTSVDKGSIVDSIRKYSTSRDGNTLTLVDIHGNILSLNFARFKVANLKVIEIF